MRAFDAGWGGVVTKTIGLHPVVNVLGPKTKFLRADADSPRLSMKKRPGAALHSSWNWELISDKTLDWWVPRLGRIKKAYPSHVLVASIMLLQRAQRQRAKLLCRVGLEEVRPAVDRVNRLPRGPITREQFGDALVRLVERIEKRRQRGFRNGGIRHDAGSIILHLHYETRHGPRVDVRAGGALGRGAGYDAVW